MEGKLLHTFLKEEEKERNKKAKIFLQISSREYCKSWNEIL